MSLCFCFHVTHSLTNGRPPPPPPPPPSPTSELPPFLLLLLPNTPKQQCKAAVLFIFCPVGGRSKGSFYRILSSLRAIVTPERLFLAPLSASWSAKLFFSLFLTHIVFSLPFAAYTHWQAYDSVWPRCIYQQQKAGQIRSHISALLCQRCQCSLCKLAKSQSKKVAESGQCAFYLNTTSFICTIAKRLITLI